MVPKKKRKLNFNLQLCLCCLNYCSISFNPPRKRLNNTNGGAGDYYFILIRNIYSVFVWIYANENIWPITDKQWTSRKRKRNKKKDVKIQLQRFIEFSPHILVAPPIPLICPYMEIFIHLIIYSVLHLFPRYANENIWPKIDK